MYTLGVWDGHDSGAALIDEDRVVFAANEERFTKRKLEIKFPVNAIQEALKQAKLKPSDIENIAFTTTELTKTASRVFPSMKENYYSFRRRKIPKPPFENLRHHLKYNITSIGILPLCGTISRACVSGELKRIGFENFKLDIVEHHTAHAATAAFTSGMDRALVITLDGLGDGLCGSVSTFENGRLERRLAIKARDSIGIFFEQVTNILGMRELEDEGKVMAMACYSYPFAFEENRMKDFFKVVGTTMTAKYGPSKQFTELQSMAWGMPREQFAYMAQQLLENVLAKYVSNLIDRYSIGDVVLAGGIFANVKANMMMRNLEHLKHWYVFPHMGDGGIALGSALYSAYEKTGRSSFDFSAYLGSEYSQEYTENIAKSDRSLACQREDEAEQASHAAELIEKGNYLFWFQGKMEYGPRALGNRSILTRSDSEEAKERLNIYVKKREWFQPFAPSIISGDAERILDYDGKGVDRDRHMTMAYNVKEKARPLTKSVMHIDGSARPHVVGDENPAYAELLRKLKRKTGHGIVLNTSFNLHGFPIVMTPEDAIQVMKATKTKYMFMNGVFITNKAGAQ
jgi:carbamoyltransferase